MADATSQVASPALVPQKVSSAEALCAALPVDIVNGVLPHLVFDAWVQRTYATTRAREIDARIFAKVNRAFAAAFLPARLMIRSRKDPATPYGMVHGILLLLQRHPRLPNPCLYCFIHVVAYKCMTCKLTRSRGVFAQDIFLEALSLGVIASYVSGALKPPTRHARELAIRMLCSWFCYMDRFHIERMQLPTVREHVEQAYRVVDALS